MKAEPTSIAGPSLALASARCCDKVKFGEDHKVAALRLLARGKDACRIAGNVSHRLVELRESDLQRVGHGPVDARATGAVQTKSRARSMDLRSPTGGFALAPDTKNPPAKEGFCPS
jgi:hypothetical protein